MVRSWIIVAIATGMSANAAACSPFQVEPFLIEPVGASGEIIPSHAPVVRVVEVHRGRRASEGEDLCVETAFVSLCIEDASPSAPFVYSFKQVGGEAPDSIFPGGLFLGQGSDNGERQFSFVWPERSEDPKPFAIEVQVTPYSRSGTPGPSTTLVVRSEI